MTTTPAAASAARSAAAADAADATDATAGAPALDAARRETLTRLKQQVAAAVHDHAEQTHALSRAIHDDPELSWQEHRAAARVAEHLQAAGLDAVVGAHGVETAVEAALGDGELTVAVCAEYDALPGVGHACGHNMITAMGTAAVLALRDVAAEAGLTVRLLGTPAEEHGGGKVALLQAGAFEDVACAVMAHPSSGPDLPGDSFASTAVERFEVTFTGRAAHAAGAPQQGISAAAAATLAQTAVGLIRQTMPPQTSVNTVITDGGEATNIIPGRTTLDVEVRAADLDTWREVKRRVLACFEGAATATGCEWSHRRTEHPYAPMDPDPMLVARWDENFAAQGRTLTPAAGFSGGSTDMGNVSQTVPALHGMVSIPGQDAVPHHPDFAAAAATPAAEASILDGAIALAWTILDVALDPAARGDLLGRRAARPAGATRETLDG